MIFPKPYIIISGIITLLFSCSEKEKKMNETVFKKEIVERVGYTEENYNKIYTYYWVAKDTSDLKFTLYEKKIDNTVLLVSEHNKQIDFSVLLDSLNNALPEIRKDFDLYKIESFSFKQPLYYPDLNHTLTTAYQKRFGDKWIDYPELKEFLLSASLTPQLNTFFNPLHKKVKSYSIEKFHLLDKQRCIKLYPNMDFSTYPDFMLSGIGIYVDLEEL